MAQHVPTNFTEHTAVLVGTGPSLTVAQIGLCRQAHVDGRIAMFGVNDAYRICDFLDYLYVADKRWIDHHRDSVKAHHCEKWCHADARMDPDQESFKGEQYQDWVKVETAPKKGFSVDRARLHRGNHGGYQVANLAYLMGCTTLILIGYDGHSGGQHFFGQHPQGTMRVDSNFENFNKAWADVAEQLPALGLNIINCTPGSAINDFPRRDLAEVLYG